jgi:hypothetical protein
MKRFIVIAAGGLMLFAFLAFAAERPVAPATGKTAPVGAATSKVTKMRAPGTILEITDKSLALERTGKGGVEKMVFVLEKPMKFKVGDKVRVSYVESDDRMIVTTIVKIVDPAAKKPIAPGKGAKPAAPTPAKK